MFKKISVSLMAIIILGFLWFSSQAPIFGKYSKQTEVYLYPYTSTPITVDDIEQGLTFIKYGEACEFLKEGFVLDDFLSEFHAKRVFSESFDGKVSVYAYSPKLKYKQVLRGKTINLHVVVSDQVVKVGSPIIYGSY